MPCHQGAEATFVAYAAAAAGGRSCGWPAREQPPQPSWRQQATTRPWPGCLPTPPPPAETAIAASSPFAVDSFSAGRGTGRPA
jgi:hypothetical protein